jgi:hypothetical protein
MNLARAAYHERSLGQGLDDYYSEWGERPGVWWGGGAELLGLEGYAAPGSIVSLIEGRDPLTGEHLRRTTSNCWITRRVFDAASGEVVERQVKQTRVGGWDFRSRSHALPREARRLTRHGLRRPPPRLRPVFDQEMPPPEVPARPEPAEIAIRRRSNFVPGFCPRLAGTSTRTSTNAYKFSYLQALYSRGERI